MIICIVSLFRFEFRCVSDSMFFHTGSVKVLSTIEYSFYLTVDIYVHISSGMS